MTTTISTVTAMIVSFFASQQTFCYLQIQNDQEEDDFERKEHHFSSLDSDTVLTTKVNESEVDFLVVARLAF